ncbi:hypothetical protein [Streptomyces rhizosphaericus]|uniref:hypothetical protein n=1 Tax=Streptomyces rhizosphaericus TaxID=114699 RepID=UPI001C3F6F5B
MTRIEVSAGASLLEKTDAMCPLRRTIDRPEVRLPSSGSTIVTLSTRMSTASLPSVLAGTSGAITRATASRPNAPEPIRTAPSPTLLRRVRRVLPFEAVVASARSVSDSTVPVPLTSSSDVSSSVGRGS